jgi:hypothetical protein
VRQLHVGARDDHRHDVEPDAPAPGPVLAQPSAREPAKPLLLADTDGLGRLAEVAGPARLDFAEDDEGTARHDEVDLALAAAPVAVDDAKAMPAIERCSGVLRLPPETNAWVHARTIGRGCDKSERTPAAYAGGRLALEAGWLGDEVALREL